MGCRDQQMRILWLTCVCMLASGCASIRLPAIDPSGERILLPAPNYTTLNRNHSSDYVRPARELCPEGPVFKQPASSDCVLPPIIPNTASKSPAATLVSDSDPTLPRILVPGGCETSKHEIYDSYPQRDGETDNKSNVTLSPRRHIATVGTEVILIGGVCGKDGYYRTHEAMEWGLTQGSVGQFVDPGKPAVGWKRRRGHLASLAAGPRAKLLSNNYALARTSKRVQVLTRGTAKPSDDIFVVQGQTWIGVTSATEGETYVTLVAPAIDGWEQRQEMAVVHWIDGQWTLPASVASRSVEPITLTTRINRKLTASPVAGWIVRYEIVDGAAIFDGGTTMVEVRTDTMGAAPVRVSPASLRGGAAKVKATIIRPAGMGSGTPDRLVVGEGIVDVSWSTAVLDVQMTGPEAMEVNDTAVYRVKVTNTGTMLADSALVRVMVPPGVDLVSSLPAASTFGSRLDWSLGQMAPGESRDIEVTYRATQAGVIRHCASAQPAGGTSVESCVTTVVSADSLFIEMVGPNPEIPLEVGQNVQYQVTITNRGNQRLTDIVLSDRFDPGLRHSEGASPIERPLEPLNPGQSHQIGLNFQVVSPGRHCHTLEATASGTKPARTSACITAQVPPQVQPGVLTVKKTGPAQAIVGQQVTFQVTVQNSGQSPVTNIQIVDQFDPELRPTTTNPQAVNSSQNQVIWYLSRLEPGEQKTFQTTCQVLFDSQRSCSRVSVRAADGIEIRDEACLLISGQPVGGSPNPLPGGAPPANSRPAAPSAGPVGTISNNGLQVSIDDRGEQFKVGGQVEYLVVIRNDSQSPDSNVILTVKLPPQLRLKNYSGPVTADTHSADWRTIVMAPLRTLRVGETVQFEVVATVEQAGNISTRVELSSLRMLQPVVQEARSVAVE